MNESTNLPQPFFFKTQNTSDSLIILTHGFGASTTETKPLGEFLKNHGYDVYGVLLSGHGKNPRDIDTVKWKDWVNDIQVIYEKYVNKYKNLILGGISFGGALSLYLSSVIKPNGLFLINSLYKLPKIDCLVVWFLHLFRVHIPKRKARIEWYAKHNLYSYPDDSSVGFYELIKLLHLLKKRIKTIKIPTLIIQSRADKTIPPQSGRWIYEDLKTEKELFELEEGDHILTVDENAQKAFEKIEEFLEKLTKGE
ncbi:MAG: alpha/beta hydrolase [Candidatus Heimdallarchaeaceae archaeon]